MIHQLLSKLHAVSPFPAVSAHCDIPCKIYDPFSAQLAALSVIRFVDLLNELAETDRINIHTFSTDVQSMLESSDVLKDEIWQKSQKYVDQISAEGGTNLYIGLEKALQVFCSYEISKKK